MGGHHLILGELVITSPVNDWPIRMTNDTRQKIARFLVQEKGYAREDVHPRNPLTVSAGDRKGRLWVDFMVTV